jgi:hypothetical protein
MRARWSRPHRVPDIRDQVLDHIGRVLSERRLAVAHFACRRATVSIEVTSDAAIVWSDGQRKKSLEISPD